MFLSIYQSRLGSPQGYVSVELSVSDSRLFILILSDPLFYGGYVFAMSSETRYESLFLIFLLLYFKGIFRLYLHRVDEYFVLEEVLRAQCVDDGILQFEVNLH